MKFHHIGVVVKNIKEAFENYKKYLGFDKITEIYTDEVQQVRVAFLEIGDNVMIELIEPLGEDSPIMNFLKKGGGLNHICYQVEDIEKEVETLREKGALIVCKPVPARAYEGNKIAFLYTPDKNLIELVET